MPEFPYLTYKFEGSIVIGVYKKVSIDIELARRIVRDRLELFNGKSYPSLADVRELKYVSKEARDYFAKQGTEGITALAIVTGSYLTVVIANLFLTFSKPKMPTRAFKTKEQALKWLQQFVKV